MTVALSSPVTGAAQSGLTTPTYTLTSMNGPDVNVKQWAVTALGGTQTGVTTHSAPSPFTLGYWVTKVYRALGKPNPTTGLISSVPYNVQRFQLRKGVTPAANQPFAIFDATLTLKVPAGSETYDAANIRAGLSALFGAVSQQSQGIGDTAVTGLS